MEIEKTCPICGTAFMAKSSSNIYCSRKCSYEALKARQKEACRERMKRAPIRECRMCGQAFQQFKKNYVFCPSCRAVKNLKKDAVGTCVLCGKEYATTPGDFGAKCPACLKKEGKRKKGRQGVKRFEAPRLYGEMIQPGGWTGPIEKEEDRPVQASIRIPVNKLPYRGRPTKDKAYEQASAQEIAKAVAQATLTKDLNML